MTLKLREMTSDEQAAIKRLARSRTASAREVERARIVEMASSGERVPAIATRLEVVAKTVRTWLKRFNAGGVDGLRDQPRSGRPTTFTPEQVSEVIAAALTNPQDLELPFGCWTLNRLAVYMREKKDISIKRSRIDELLVAEGLRWRKQETWFGERVDPEFAKKGRIEQLYLAPPEGSVVICLDEMGPESAKSFLGPRWIPAAVEPTPVPPAGRAAQEIDYGRRGKGYVFGAFEPTTGEAFTRCYHRRTAANWIAFLEQVDAWVPAATQRVYAILDNLGTHRASDVLLFSLANPRWEFVFQPIYAAYLNLIEPWWKVLRSLALKGRRFETWEEIEQAVAAATTYWNAHRHPFVWGRRRRHKHRRQSGVALVPKAA